MNDTLLQGHSSIDDKRAFERWYCTHAFDYEREPLGSRECSLQRKAWIAARAEPVRKFTDETVEEMSKLFHEANNYRGSWDGHDCPFKNSIRVGMRAALKTAGIEATQ